MLGKTISHYKITEKIGEGGMGIVYKAQDTRLGRTVALKFLAPHLLASPEEKTRFFQEAQMAASLDHPHICTIYEIDEAENQIFIAMAYLEGQSLKEKLQSGTLTLEEIARITLQITEGLKAAHQQDIVHRDIKSSNIIITKENQAKILDFGLAKWSGSTLVTKPGTTTRGTVAYMSPEQAQGVPVDQRTDIWSVGVVLYEMLTGQLPFRSEYEQAVIYSILNEEPPPISATRTEVPKEWEKIVNKCLQKNPAQRYQTIGELQSELKGVMRQMGLRETLEQFTTTVIKKPSFTSIYTKIFFGVTGLFLFLVLLLLFPSSQQTIKRWFGIAPIPLQKHLVVLPFTNIGGEPKNQAFCDGLVETLNSKLSQLEQFQGTLRVVPASDVRKFKVTNTEEARKILGVPMALTGSVQITEDSMRLTLSLIDTKTLKKIKSSMDAYPMSNLANMQNQALRKIAQMLKIELQPKAQKMLGEGTTSVSTAYVLYLQGRGYLVSYEKKENLDTAIGLFNKALEGDSLYSLAYVALAEAYWRKHEVSKDPQWIDPATKNCTQALQLNQKLPTAHLTWGIIHLGSGRYTEAVDDFQKTLELDSVSLEAYINLAEAYESLGETEKAEFAYRKAIKVRPSYWRGYNYLAVFYSRHGRYQDALDQLQQVISLSPENIRGYNNLGAIFLILKRLEDSRQMYKHSLNIQPNYVAYQSLGNLYFFQEARYADAARMYQKALELDSSDYRVWGSLASAYYWSAAERSKAFVIYQRAAKMAEEKRRATPRDAALLSHLADFYSMLGKKEKALPFLEQSLALAPDDPEVLARAGDTYEQLGQREKALEWMGKALKKGYSLERVQRSPGLEGLLSDSRFKRLIKELSGKLQK